MRKADQASLREEIQFHDETASDYEQRNLLGMPYAMMRNQARVTRLMRFAGKYECPRILEVGCGIGYILKPLMESVQNATYYAFDISQRMIERTRDEVAGCNQECDLLVGDAMEIPFEGDAFHVVYCVATLHHIPDVALALAEFQRVLTNGGVLYLEEPLSNQITHLLRRVLRRNAGLSPQERAGFSLPSLVRAAGRVLSVRGYECFGTLSPVAKYVRSRSVTRVLWAFERAFFRLPLAQHFALNVRLWAEKT